MHLRAYLAAGLVAALAAGALWLNHRAYWRGWDAHAAQVAAETRELQRELHRLADRNSELSRELAAQDAARDDLAEELRDAAENDPRGDDPGLPDSSLRRLDRIR